MRKLYTTFIFLLFFITNNAQITFVENIVVDGQNELNSVHSADLDGDNDKDVLFVSAFDDRIGWYENIDGQGTFSNLQLISTSADYPTSVFAIDIDGDGDMDVLSSSALDDKIAWYENLDGQGNFGAQQTITTNADIAYSVYSTDIDGDGDFDVVSASSGDNKIAWYENMDGLGTFGIQQVLPTSLNGVYWVHAEDIDGDGDMDILSASTNGATIAWHENTDGLGTFAFQSIILFPASQARAVYAIDIDNDNDIDVLSAYGNTIAWHENVNGQGGFSSEQIISNTLDGAESVFAIDVNGDSFIDVISASKRDGVIAWYENTDGLGSFGTEQVVTTDVLGAESVYADDLDNDGDIDLLSASSDEDKIAWYENLDGQGSFGPLSAITPGSPKGVYSVFSADFDGDGDQDILSGSIDDNKIAWYENIDGLGNFSNQKTISTNNDEVLYIHADDIDGDGDMDALSASQYEATIAWYENTDGLGSFDVQNVIALDAIGAESIYTTDIDGDGDVDVLLAYTGGINRVVWYENLDGLGDFGTEQIISNSHNAPKSVHSTDIDGDGDMDVIAASQFDDKVAWYENLDGLGGFGTEQIISSNADGALSVYTADLDGDGDQDLVSGALSGDQIVWYENTDGLGSFGSPQLVSNNSISTSSVFCKDLDDDGDIDILAASFNNDKVVWYENTDGQGGFGNEQVINSNLNGPRQVRTGDINGDGNLDVVSSALFDDRIVWFENQSSLSISDNLQKSFSAYPNPVNDKLNIYNSNSIDAFSIYDIKGRMLITGTVQLHEIELVVNVESLSKGIYILEIQSGESKSTKKFIKN